MREEEREILNVAVLAGHILLENGAEIFRVEETIDRICHAYGVESEDSFILSSGLFITAGNEKEEYYARVKHIPLNTAHLGRVAAVNQLSREIVEGRYTILQVRERLEEIRVMPKKTKRAQILASGVGSGSFCYLFGGNFVDSGAAFLVGLLLYCYILFVSNKHLSKIVAKISGGALVTFFCILLYHSSIGDHLNQMIIGSIIPLVPGLSFTNGIRDIADGDYISGSVRLLDALLIVFCIAMGVGLVFTIYQRIIGGIRL